MALISVHMLQNHAPSNLNRDENGDPKDAMFGSVRRARISSQAIKRAIRQSDTFKDYFTGLDVLAVRSKLRTHIDEYLKKSGKKDALSEDQYKRLLEEAAKIGNAGKAEKIDAAQGETSPKGQLMFLTSREIATVTDKLIEWVQNPVSTGIETAPDTAEKGKKGKKDAKTEAAGPNLGTYTPHSVDIAMFGRMTTSSPFMDVEASVQVAHAISTHRVEQDFDFFTAVDDLKTEAGAGLLGETAFNSATYYKYINIHWDSLLKNLGDDSALALATVKALIHAAIVSNPSGKQNTFAAHNPPDWVLIEIRESNIPLSYANAFVKPVRPINQLSLIEASASAIEDYILRTDRTYDVLPKPERLLMRNLQMESVLGLADVSMSSLLSHFDTLMLQ